MLKIAALYLLGWSPLLGWAAVAWLLASRWRGALRRNIRGIV
jgi:hypothetical protein